MGHSSLTPFPTCASVRGMLSENIFLALAIGAQCHISVSEQDDVTVQVFFVFFPPVFWNDGTRQHERDGQAQPQESITLEERLISDPASTTHGQNGGVGTIFRGCACHPPDPLGPTPRLPLCTYGILLGERNQNSILCFTGPFPGGPGLRSLRIK